MLIENSAGNYHFLTGIAPYSSGVVAAAGYQIVRAVLAQPLPYREGFQRIERYLRGLGRPRAALCAMELRLPKPLSFAGFAAFNGKYQQILEEWGLLIDGRNPVARTNVAPAVRPPAQPSLYAFSYTLPQSENDQVRTFVVAGAGDLRDQTDLSMEATVRPYETSPEALQAKARTVMAVMQDRLRGLGMDWPAVTEVDIYTSEPLYTFLEVEILSKLGPAATHGVHWYYSYPPIAGLVFEMDLRGVHRQIYIQ